MGQAQTRMTVAEYLELTASGTLTERLEWINGEAYAMAGGSPEHAAVGTNITTALAIGLRKIRCRPTNGEQRIAIDDTGAYVYPDAAVVCGPYNRAADGISITNPSVVFEVLSPSTRAVDSGAKFMHYRRIESLTDYVLVDPDARTVAHYVRRADEWVLRDIATGALSLMAGTLSISVDDIFVDLDDVVPQD